VPGISPVAVVAAVFGRVVDLSGESFGELVAFFAGQLGEGWAALDWPTVKQSGGVVAGGRPVGSA